MAENSSKVRSMNLFTPTDTENKNKKRNKFLFSPLFLGGLFLHTFVGVSFGVEPLNVLEILGEYFGARLILSLARVLFTVLFE